jgi:hypothetical protein
LDSLGLDHDRIVAGWLDRYGDYRMGRVEADPELAEYEELILLGRSLAGRE